MRSALLTALFAMAMVACQPRFLAGEPDPEITVQAVVANGSVVVTGEADLPDGTSLDVQVVQWDAFQEELGANESLDPTYKHGPRQTVIVSSGSFAATFDVAGWPPGKGAAIIGFATFGQPQALVDRYGVSGERLEGPDVVDGSDGRYVEVSREIVLPKP